MRRSLKFHPEHEQLHQWLDRIVASGVTIDREILGEVSKQSYIAGSDAAFRVISNNL